MLHTALGAFLVLAGVCRAAAPADPPHFKDMSEAQIAQSLLQIHKENPLFADRIAAVSGALLGIPYYLGPMGEGPDGEFDRSPTYSFRSLDCTTFVEETMALSLEPDLEKAKALLQKIRYKDGKVSYQTRNHFPEVDWRANNEAAGFLKDVTRDVAGDGMKVEHKLISKRAWYVAHTTDDIKGLGGLPKPAAEAKLKALQALGGQFQDEVSTEDYVPLAMLPQVLDRIPSGTVANLVRADLPGKAQVITHQMLIVRRDGKTFVRHAAYGKTMEEQPADSFFHRYDKASWPVVGINLEQILDRQTKE
jgi:hypothetical protein